MFSMFRAKLNLTGSSLSANSVYQFPPSLPSLSSLRRLSIRVRKFDDGGLLSSSRPFRNPNWGVTRILHLNSNHSIIIFRYLELFLYQSSIYSITLIHNNSPIFLLFLSKILEPCAAYIHFLLLCFWMVVLRDEFVMVTWTWLVDFVHTGWMFLLGKILLLFRVDERQSRRSRIDEEEG